MDFANYWFQAPPGGGGYQIGNSLRFRGAQYLSRTGAITAQGGVSLWVKFSRDVGVYTPGVYDPIIYLSGGGPTLYRNVYGYLYYRSISSGGDDTWNSKRTRDHSAWYHIFLKFNSSNSASLYVNNVLWGTKSANIGTANGAQRIGRNDSSYLNGYIAEYHAAFGESLDATDFGEYNADGVWVPKKVSGVNYGNQGWYLDFSDPADIGADRSGNGNNFTPTGFELTNTSSTSYDWMADSSTNNWCTFNPLYKHPTYAKPALSNGNLDASNSGGGDKIAHGTIGVKTGKFYFEYVVTTGVGSKNGLVGWQHADPAFKGSSPLSGLYRNNGEKRLFNNTTESTGVTWTDNDVIGCAVDAGAGKIWFAKNNTWIQSGDPAAGSNATLTYTTTDEYIFPSIAFDNTATTVNGTVNFGQRPFKHTPPTGFEPVSTAGMPAVAITNPSEHFQTILDTGANILTNAQATFPNGLWWIKDRTQSSQHLFVDSVRGTTKAWDCPATNAEFTYSAPSGNSVAWCWATDNAGLNTAAGFQIVTYTGNGSNRTIPHSLGVPPEYMIVRRLTPTGDTPITYHSYTGGTVGTALNSYHSTANSQYWNDTNPTSSVFSLGTEGGVNSNGANYVAYLWAPIPGYSAMGGYNGNGDADGPFIYLGFRPAYVFIKAYSAPANGPATEDGIIYDSARSTYNPNDTCLHPQQEWGEPYAARYIHPIDMLSNGFKIRGTESRYNNSSYRYFYVAFAEHPFGGANISPSPAR